MRDEDAVVLTLSHPHGDLEMGLEDWIATGPGPRPLLRPTSARRSGTGEPLPLSVVPLRYRNTRLSRFLVSLGLLERPWG